MAKDEEKAPPSFGNIGEHHWSRTRKDENREAVDYYRERSKAPGVAEGGGPRNFYCMSCDGVIPFDQAAAVCPHCGAAIEENVKRYFNWVEIAEPAGSDLKALLRIAAPVVLLLVALALVAWWWLA
ncbi:MAG: hypothetical protein K8S98_09880 [Planctomycetes bacterium]|nr:hypothetical protein [Planctomycetota bacterium]